MSEMSEDQYYGYWDGPNRYIRLHRAECRYCNHGRGVNPPTKPNCGWEGPSSIEGVLSALSDRAAWDVHACKECNPPFVTREGGLSGCLRWRPGRSSSATWPPVIRAGLIVLVMLVSVPGDGRGDFYSGDDLFEACENFPDGCVGYVMGINDALSAMRENGGPPRSWRSCVRSGHVGTSDHRRRDKISDRASRAPTFQLSASIVATALFEAFPCSTVMPLVGLTG